LVVQGLDDVVAPGGPAGASTIYNALPTSVANKVLVQVDCASYEMLWESCSHAARRTPAYGVPYGTEAGRLWAGAHSIVSPL
jgi:hypothetical protein